MIRKFDSDALRTMKLFGSVCGSKPVDYFEAEDSIIFITSPGQTGKAIGKSGVNIKRLRTALNKDVKVIENADTLENLISNYLFPIKPKKVEQNHSAVSITFSASKERRAVLNNSQKELKKLKATVSRYYPKIKDIQILQ